jgi:hypothetical protein
MTAPADSASTPAFLAATARHPLWRLGTWIPVCAKWALELQISHICAWSDATLDLDLPLFGTCVGADGDLDLIVGNGWGCSNLYTCCSGGPTSNEANELLINNGTGGFSKSDTFPAGNAQTHAVAFADVDGDLDLDLLIGNFNGANEILLNNGTGGFDKDPNFPAGSTTTSAVAFGDVDGGDLHLVLELLTIRPVPVVCHSRDRAPFGCRW